jgi:uncharacterized protein (TIGR03435 family)
MLAGAVLAAVVLVPVLDAQAPAPEPNPLPTFEVAAVKPNKTGQGFIRFGMLPGGRFTAENVPLRELIRFAYQIQPYQMEGVPGWANTDRFDVTAKAENDPGPVQPGQVGPIQFMMRALLKERFGFAYHIETKDAPVYNLVLARADGTFGPRLEKSTTDCQAMFAARRGGGPGGPGAPGGPGGPGGPAGRGGPGGPGGPPPFDDFTQKIPCGFRVGPGLISGGAMALSQLVQFLSQNLGRTVVDKTGLEGNFDFNITYTPDQIPAPPPGGNAPGGPPPFPAIDPNGPSLTTALQEQLGLKLDATRGPITVFVVDKASQPTTD